MNERHLRMFQDGQNIGEVASLEIDNLLKENELYLKACGINSEDHKVFCNIGMSRILVMTMSLGIAIKLIPGLLRIVANSVEIIIQNAEREKRSGK